MLMQRCEFCDEAIDIVSDHLSGCPKLQEGVRSRVRTRLYIPGLGVKGMGLLHDE